MAGLLSSPSRCIPCRSFSHNMSLGKAHRGPADIMGSESGELQEDLKQTDSQILPCLTLAKAKLLRGRGTDKTIHASMNLFTLHIWK